MEKENINHWGVEDFDYEANEQGIIEGSFSVGNDNYRDYSEEVNYNLDVIEDRGNAWFVTAIITKSETKTYKKNMIVEFELYKDTDIFELDYEVKRAFEEDRHFR